MLADIQTARKGDIIRFESYALHVDEEPKHGNNNSIILSGRISINGCPTVTKLFIGELIVEIERATNS